MALKLIGCLQKKKIQKNFLYQGNQSRGRAIKGRTNVKDTYKLESKALYQLNAKFCEKITVKKETATTAKKAKIRNGCGPCESQAVQATVCRSLCSLIGGVLKFWRGGQAIRFL